jgi:hypothetical protein
MLGRIGERSSEPVDRCRNHYGATENVWTAEGLEIPIHLTPSRLWIPLAALWVAVLGAVIWASTAYYESSIDTQAIAVLNPRSSPIGSHADGTEIELLTYLSGRQSAQVRPRMRVRVSWPSVRLPAKDGSQGFVRSVGDANPAADPQSAFAYRMLQQAGVVPIGETGTEVRITVPATRSKSQFIRGKIYHVEIITQRRSLISLILPGERGHAS